MKTDQTIDLGNALSAQAGPQGVRWLLVADGPRRVLHSELRALLTEPWKLAACRLQRARLRLKPDIKLTAYYSVEVEPSSGASTTRDIAVYWKPKWIGAPPDQPHPDSIEMEAEALRRGLATPFRRLHARVPAWGMRIQVSPLDTRFPQLARVCDPDHVCQMLSGICASRNSSSSQARSYTVSSIRYFPGQRHVLRYDSKEVGGRTVFAMLYKGEQGSRVFQIQTQLAESFAARGGSLSCLKPLAYVPDDAVILYPLASGTPLHKSLQSRDREIGTYLELAGQALGLLHQAPKTLAGELEPHRFEAEIAEVERAWDYIPALSPSTGAMIKAVIDRAKELYERLPQEPPAFTHCDFRAEHAWVTPEGLTLIDFDSSHLSDPALDIGKFLADLVFWYDTWRQPDLGRAQDWFLAGYASGVPSDRLVRARLYQALELAKMAGRRVQLFDEQWATQTEKLVRVGRRVMDRLEELLGLRVDQPASKKAFHVSSHFAESGAGNDPRHQARRGTER